MLLGKLENGLRRVTLSKQMQIHKNQAFLLGVFLRESAYAKDAD